MQRPRLSLRTMLLYGAGSTGANMVAAFSNAALPLYLIPYGLPGWLVGLLAQERSGVAIVAHPLIGMLSDRTRSRLGRRRPYFLVGAPLTALSLVILSLYPPLLPMLVVVSLLALLLAIANDPYLALLADITPADQRGQVGSIMGIFGMAGQVAVLVAASLLWNTHEPLVIWAVAVGLLVSFAITFLGVSEPTLVETRPLPSAPAAYLREVVGYREIVKYGLAMTFFWLGAGAAGPFLTRFGVFELGLDEGTSFLLVMTLVLCTALAAYPAGRLGDRVGKKPVQLVGLALFALAALAGSQAHTMEQILPAIVLVGVANAIPFVLALPLLADIMPKRRAGEFTGLGAMLWSVMQPAGAMLGGALADVSGGYRLGFVFAGLMMGCSFLALLTVDPTRGARDAAAADRELGAAS